MRLLFHYLQRGFRGGAALAAGPAPAQEMEDTVTYGHGDSQGNQQMLHEMVVQRLRADVGHGRRGS